MSLASLLPFCCLRMPSSRGEAYLQRLGGKGHLRHVVSSSMVSVTLSPLSTSVTPSLSSHSSLSLSLSLVSAPVQALPAPRTFPPAAGPTSTIVTVPASAAPDSYTCTAVCVNSLLHARSGLPLAVSSMQSHQASATVVLGSVHPTVDAFPSSASAVRPSASPRLPEFLAKNQSPGDLSPVIHIKPFTSILCPDDEDRTLCPVRALRIYRRQTSVLCATRRHLFIPWNKGYAQDIRRSSVSWWLAQVISAAYVRSGSDLPGVVSRPHEVRAWASSLVFAHSRSLRDIMEAAYWCLQATFIQFYLRDVSCLQDDGSHGVVSAVVAQQAVSSRSSRAATPRTGRRSRAATSRT